MQMVARPGGALYPVLLIAVVLFGMAMALPQVLIGAGSSMQLDSGRDRKREALESAVAFAEARLKRDLSNLALGGPAELGVVLPAAGAQMPVNGLPLSKLGQFTVKPSYANPDYGRRRSLDWEVKCLRVAIWGYDRSELSGGTDPGTGKAAASSYEERYRFNYLLDAAAWAADPVPGKPRTPGLGGAELHEEIAGTIEVKVKVDLGQTGVPMRRLEGDVRIAAMAQPRFDAFVRSASPPPRSPGGGS